MMYRKDISFLDTIYHTICHNSEGSSKRLTDEETKVTYKRKQEEHEIHFGNTVFCLTKEEMMDLIGGTISLLEEIYPLGTVVELKLKLKNPKTMEDENLAMVITKRFVSPKGKADYFEYGGVPYPTGLLEENHVIFFTQESIQNVLQKGFCDERDQAFVCTMKHALIVKGNHRSVTFSEKKEKNQKDQNKGENWIEQGINS